MGNSIDNMQMNDSSRLIKMVKKSLVICDCIDCPNVPTWVQAFTVKNGVAIVNLCREHHFILRTKVPNSIPLDENVLKWLLIQDANAHTVTKYGIWKSSADIKAMRELKKIELDIE